ncbi:MAG TPA: hypothetical protein VF762_02355 [Blastocatellia bacterium]|jgi:hypothetical protein
MGETAHFVYVSKPNFESGGPPYGYWHIYKATSDGAKLLAATVFLDIPESAVRDLALSIAAHYNLEFKDDYQAKD